MSEYCICTQNMVNDLKAAVRKAEKSLYSTNDKLLLSSMLEWKCHYTESKICSLLNNENYFNSNSVLLEKMLIHHTEWLNKWQIALDASVDSNNEHETWINMVGLEDQLYSMLEDFETKIPKINAEIIANEYNLEKTSIPEIEKLLGGLTL